MYRRHRSQFLSGRKLARRGGTSVGQSRVQVREPWSALPELDVFGPGEPAGADPQGQAPGAARPSRRDRPVPAQVGALRVGGADAKGPPW